MAAAEVEELGNTLVDDGDGNILAAATNCMAFRNVALCPRQRWKDRVQNEANVVTRGCIFMDVNIVI